MTVIGGGSIISSDGLLPFGWAEVDAGVITAIGAGGPGQQGKPIDVDLRGRILAPGFVDMHCHGGGGTSLVTTDAADARNAALTHLRNGTTSLMGGLVAASRTDLLAQIATLSPLVDEEVLIGIHLEGPWISSLHCGAHDRAQLRLPVPGEVAELLKAGGGRIRMVTIAPELDGGIDAIRQIVEAGAVAAIGHTDADYDLAMEAITAGATVATHLWNAERSLHHRDPGVIGALLDSDVTIELIADGHHVHPSMLRLVINAAGYDRIALVTDAMAAAGSADGRYVLGTLDVTVVDGEARLTHGGAIASSTLTADQALRYAVEHVGVPLVAASAMASGVPARALGLTDRGVIAPGYRADLAVLGEGLNVEAVMVRGQWVHTSPGVQL